jgi:hypothetical protein
MEEEPINEELLNDLKGLAEQMQALNEQAYYAYLPLVNEIIQSDKRDLHEIEHLMDRLLTFACDEKCLELYRSVCRYVWSFNQEEAAYHIHTYREMWDSEGENENENENEKEENKDR